MLKEANESYLVAQGGRNFDIGIKNAKRLIYLTEEMDDLARLEEGKINLRLSSVRMSSYLKMLSEMFVGTADYKGLHFRSKASCPHRIEH